MDWIAENQELFIILFIPFTCALVGWGTNWMAVKMIFAPLNYIGISKLGWQGIIPRHSIKMSTKIRQIITEKLITPHELYERVDPQQINHHIADLLDLKAEEIIEDIMKAQNPALWNLLPDFAKRSLADDVKKEIPDQITEVYHSFGKDIDQVLDFDSIIKSSLSGRNTRYLIEMFQRCGGPEFAFIVRSGFWFGLAIGLIQLVFIGILGKWWVMPIMGGIIGYATNYLALQMIFRPLEATKFIIIYYQGLFLKRQAEVSREFASVIANRVFHPENLIRMIFQGKGGDLIIELVAEKSRDATEKLVQSRGPLAPMLLGPEKMQQVKDGIAEKLTAMIPSVAHRIQYYLADTLQIEKTVGDRLSFLPPEEFEDLLHSVFKEDEMTLIALGAMLGAMAGGIQAFIVYF